MTDDLSHFQRLIPIQTSDTCHVTTVMDKLNKRSKQSLVTVDDHGMNKQFPRYMYQITREYEQRVNPGPTIYHLAEYVGRQPNGVWVLSPDLQLGADGLEVEEELRFLWDVNRSPQHVINFDDIGPQDHTGHTLHRLLLAMKAYFQPEVNWPASLCLFGGTVLSLAYEPVMSVKNMCPVVLATGPPAAGKTSALRACLSAVGRSDVDDFTETSALFESETSSLPFGWDDPQNSKTLGGAAMQLFNKAGKTSYGRKKETKPKSLPVVTANFHRFEKEAQTSRFAIILFRRTTTQPRSTYRDAELYAALEEAKAEAPRALASLIPIVEGFGLDEEQAVLSDLEDKVNTLFNAGPRTSQIYGHLMYFVQALLSKAELLGEMDAVWDYMKDVVGPLVKSNTTGPSCSATPPASTDVVAAVAAALESMTLREINRSIKWAKRDTVVAIVPALFFSFASAYMPGISQADIESITPSTVSKMHFLHPDSREDSHKQRDGKDILGKSKQKTARVLKVCDYPTLYTALKDQVAQKEAAQRSAGTDPEVDALQKEWCESEQREWCEAEQREAEQREAEQREVEQREAAKREAEKREAAKREAAKREAAKREAAKREAAKREAAKREAAKREAAKREAAKREAAKREAAKREAEKREAEKRETEKKETEEKETEEKETEEKETEEKETEKTELRTSNRKRKLTDKQAAALEMKLKKKK
ncbi:uncharacterized protein LOC144885886 [Branchiostoma floridae x Branchiostoma japonicum]